MGLSVSVSVFVSVCAGPGNEGHAGSNRTASATPGTFSPPYRATACLRMRLPGAPQSACPRAYPRSTCHVACYAMSGTDIAYGAGDNSPERMDAAAEELADNTRHGYERRGGLTKREFAEQLLATVAVERLSEELRRRVIAGSEPDR
eukprot:698766-Rhodomonas_salina.2